MDSTASNPPLPAHRTTEPCLAAAGGGRCGPAGNALKHGLSATKLLPRLLSPDRLADLIALLRQEYQPCTITEELLVTEAGRHAAALELIQHAEPAVMRQAVQTLDLVMQATQESDDWQLAAAVTSEPLDRCARYRRAHEKSLHQALDKLRLFKAERATEAGKQVETATGDGEPTPAAAPQLDTESDCQRYLRHTTFSAAWRCPACRKPHGHWLASRHAWQCAACGQQTGLRYGTVFARSPLSLTAWFSAIRRYAGQTNIDAPSLATAIGIDRLGTVRSMLRRIRQAVAEDDCQAGLAGLISYPLP